MNGDFVRNSSGCCKNVIVNSRVETTTGVYNGKRYVQGMKTGYIGSFGVLGRCLDYGQSI